MAIKIPRSRVPFATKRLARSRPATMEAQAEERGQRAIANLGVAVFDQFNKSAAASARNRVSRGVEEFKFKFAQDMAEVEGTDNALNVMNKAFEEWGSQREQLVVQNRSGLNPFAKKLFDNVVTKAIPSVNFDMKNTILKVGLQKAQQSEVNQNAQRLSVATSSQETAAVTAGIVARRGILGTEFPRQLQIANKAHNDMLTAEKMRAVDAQILETVTPDGGFENAEKLVTSPEFLEKNNITLDEASERLNQIQNLAESKVAQEKVELERQQDQDRQNLFDVIVDEDYENLAKKVDETSLGGNEKELWLSKLATRAKAENRGKPDPFKISNPDVYNPLFQKMAVNPDTVKLSDITDKLGKGISIDNYNVLTRMKEDGLKSPLMRDSVARGHQSIRRLSVEKLNLMRRELGKDFTLQDAREVEAEELRDQNELDAWALQNPDFTDEQLEKKLKALNRPKEEDVVLSLFERSVTTLGGIRDKELARKRVNRLKQLGVWQDLNEQERQSAQQRFLRGETVENILQLLGR